VKKLQLGSDFPSTRVVVRTLKQLGFELPADAAGDSAHGAGSVRVGRGRVYRGPASLGTIKYSAYVSKDAKSTASIHAGSKAKSKKK
jgi:hypothetical protein